MESTGIPANCDETYNVSSGYRRIANDVCEGGVEFETTVKECPNPGLLRRLRKIFNRKVHSSSNPRLSYGLSGC